MQIYTGSPFTEEDCDRIIELGLGVMLTPGYGFGKHVLRALKNCPAALDNGAFSAWQKGHGFDELPFLKTLSRLIKEGIHLEIIAVPDIVTGGMASYWFSHTWRLRLAGHKNLYLVVQDNMDYRVDLEGYAGIFVGGSTKWKWETAERWVYEAKINDLKLHIGRVGTADRLKYAAELGADSVDSTNFQRNKAWHHVEEYLSYKEETEMVDFSRNREPIEQPSPVEAVQEESIQEGEDLGQGEVTQSVPVRGESEEINEEDGWVQVHSTGDEIPVYPQEIGNNGEPIEIWGEQDVYEPQEEAPGPAPLPAQNVQCAPPSSSFSAQQEPEATDAPFPTPPIQHFNHPATTTSKTLTIEQKKNMAITEVMTDPSFSELIMEIAKWDEFSRQTAGMVIQSDEQAEKLNDELAGLVMLMNKVDLRRRTITTFPRLFTEAVNALFGGPRTDKGLYANLKRARERIEKPILKWKEDQRLAREAILKAKREQEEAAERTRQYAATESQGQAGIVGQQPPGQTADLQYGTPTLPGAPIPGLQAPGPIVAPPPIETTTKSAKATSYSVTNIDAKIVDKRLIAQAVVQGILRPSAISLVKGEWKKHVRDKQKAGESAEVPGIEIVEKKSLKVKTKKGGEGNGKETNGPVALDDGGRGGISEETGAAPVQEQGGAGGHAEAGSLERVSEDDRFEV